jgi:hypothetical protein
MRRPNNDVGAAVTVVPRPNYDALRKAAPPPRKPSRIATARFMENSRVF